MAHPAEIEPLLQQADLELERLINLEGLVAMNEQQVNDLPEPYWQTWVAINAGVAEDPCLLGAANHLLAVARKPRWPGVLAEIAAQLEAAQVPYTIAGGASTHCMGSRSRFETWISKRAPRGLIAFRSSFRIR